MVAEFLAGAGSAALSGAAATPKAIIAPHAGYIFSGPVAASAYARWAPDGSAIKRVVLIGPSHFVEFAGLAASNAEYFSTPLGRVPVDTEAVRQLGRLRQVCCLDEVHANEHSLEVHLPFLQVILDDFKIVPLLTGEVADVDVAEVISTLWGGPETRFVVSSDLSHYHDYGRARELDWITSRAIEELEPEGITASQACGRKAVCGLLHAVRQHGLRARTVELRNSGDTAGPRSQVVGYGAFVFEAPTRQS
jgi:hypothetical protein